MKFHLWKNEHQVSVERKTLIRELYMYKYNSRYMNIHIIQFDLIKVVIEVQCKLGKSFGINNEFLNTNKYILIFSIR